MSAIPAKLWTRRCRGCPDVTAHDSHLTLLGRIALGRPMKERFWTWLAWKLPRPLAYWACVRVMAHATVGPYSHQVVPELTVEDTLKRWEASNQDTRDDG